MTKSTASRVALHVAVEADARSDQGWIGASPSRRAAQASSQPATCSGGIGRAMK
jgi:hypothetical protein